MFKIVFAIAFSSLLGQAEVNVITGAPTPKGADYVGAALWRVDSNGTLTHQAELAAGDEGLHRLDMLQHERMAVLMTKYPRLRVAVLDLDTRSITKSCVIPKGVYEWASRDPLRYNIYLYLEKVVLGFDLTSSMNCRESVRPLAPAEFSLPITYGHAGVDQLASMETLDTGVDREGRIQKSLAGTSTYLGYSIPERFLKKDQRPNGSLLANTSFLLAYKIGYKNEPSRIVILHKPTGTWTELPTTNYAGLRVFGKYAVITEGHLRSESPSKLPAAQREISPGVEEWRRTEGKYGRNTDFFLRNSIMVYGGALHVFDSETRTTRTIRTGQADSEVVLIEGKDVYYRVSDRLYHAVLADNVIAGDKVIAKSEVIRDAHWAFVSK